MLCRAGVGQPIRPHVVKQGRPPRSFEDGGDVAVGGREVAVLRVSPVAEIWPASPNGDSVSYRRLWGSGLSITRGHEESNYHVARRRGVYPKTVSAGAGRPGV
jgi:hypothetical protein